MTEKVNITREQAENIEWAKSYFKEEGLQHIVNLRFSGFEIWKPVCGPMLEMELDKFIRSLYIGYEVEEEYKVGDYIANRLFSFSI